MLISKQNHNTAGQKSKTCVYTCDVSHACTVDLEINRCIGVFLISYSLSITPYLVYGWGIIRLH